MSLLNQDELSKLSEMFANTFNKNATPKPEPRSSKLPSHYGLSDRFLIDLGSIDLNDPEIVQTVSSLDVLRNINALL